VRDYLAQECVLGRILGSLNPQLYPQVHTSRFGIIPKSTPGKWRLIVDLSSPRGQCVNDGITEEVCSLSYVGAEEATRGILTYGKGARLAKVDIQSAYRTYRSIPKIDICWACYGMGHCTSIQHYRLCYGQRPRYLQLSWMQRNGLHGSMACNSLFITWTII
jgi:hypothetical protein